MLDACLPGGTQGRLGLLDLVRPLLPEVGDQEHPVRVGSGTFERGLDIEVDLHWPRPAAVVGLGATWERPHPVRHVALQAMDGRAPWGAGSARNRPIVGFVMSIRSFE